MLFMTLGLYLLSRFDVHTTRLVQSVFMAVVGLGIGLVMQVLVLAVQNTADVRDLGTATAATSFFRPWAVRSGSPASVPSSTTGLRSTSPASCRQAALKRPR
jgi:hypothetical protein